MEIFATIGSAIASASIPTILSTVGTVLAVGGQAAAANRAEQAGEAALRARIYESQVLEQQAGQSKAASQRRAMEERRRARLIASRAQAVAGASGAGVSDPTVANIIADISGEGAYRSSVELYEGEEQARQLGMEGQSRLQRGLTEQAGGKAQARALRVGAASSLLTGAGSLLLSGADSLYEKYGSGGPVMDAGTPELYPYG